VWEIVGASRCERESEGGGSQKTKDSVTTFLQAASQRRATEFDGFAAAPRVRHRQRTASASLRISTIPPGHLSDRVKRKNLLVRISRNATGPVFAIRRDEDLARLTGLPASVGVTGFTCALRREHSGSALR